MFQLFVCLDIYAPWLDASWWAGTGELHWLPASKSVGLLYLMRRRLDGLQGRLILDGAWKALWLRCYGFGAFILD